MNDIILTQNNETFRNIWHQCAAIAVDTRAPPAANHTQVLCLSTVTQYDSTQDPSCCVLSLSAYCTTIHVEI